MRTAARALVWAALLLGSSCSSAETTGEPPDTRQPPIPDCGQDPVIFPDPALEEVVRRQLGRPDGALPLSAVKGLTDLTSWSRDIESLEGLQCARELRVLDFTGSKISDLSPLAGLTKIQQLKVATNRLTSIEAIRDFKQLSFLEIAVNDISDLSPVSAMTTLTIVNIGSTAISDLSPLRGSASMLRTLRLGTKEETDVSV